MIVVSDTSPISALLKIGRMDLLEKLFGSVVAPPAVFAELRRSYRALPSFMEERIPSRRSRVEELMRSLDAGEAEAIALAEEIPAGLLLMDETRGRAVALRAGLEITGLLGVLVRAKKRGLLDSVGDSIKILKRDAGIYAADAVVEQALRMAGEL